jgi:type I restriction enzyme S subunit
MKLEKIGQTYGGLTGLSKPDFGVGDSRYITFMNIMSHVIVNLDELESVNVRSKGVQNRAENGDLFFNGSSETPEEVGMCALLANDVQNVYLNSFCFGFRLFDNTRIHGLYLAYYFRSGQGRKLLNFLAQGATRYNLSKRSFLQLRLPLPCYKEQSAISSLLSEFDQELASLVSEFSKAQHLKQSMMQQLLTGRIRLV